MNSGRIIFATLQGIDTHCYTETLSIALYNRRQLEVDKEYFFLFLTKFSNHILDDLEVGN